MVAAVAEPCIDLDEELPSCSRQPDGSGQHDDQTLGAHAIADLLPADLASHPDTVRKPGALIATLKRRPDLDGPRELSRRHEAPPAQGPAGLAGALRLEADTSADVPKPAAPKALRCARPTATVLRPESGMFVVNGPHPRALHRGSGDGGS